MLLCWNPFFGEQQCARQSNQSEPRDQYLAHEMARATRSRQPANRPADDAAAVVSTAFRESRRDVKLDDTSHYRTFAVASARSWQTLHSSQGVGKKNLGAHQGRDSPRRRLMRRNRPAGVPERVHDNDTIGLVAGIFPVHSIDNDGSPSVDAIGGRPRGRLNCNSG